jgi:hypothetical protein
LSNALIIQEHPGLVVEEITGRYGPNLTFTYSRYEVAPPGLQAMARRSAVLEVLGSDVTPEWIADHLSDLGPNEELAWHSRVDCKGVSLHIPMVDFVGRPDRSLLRDAGRTLTAEIGIHGSLIVFDTERSFHGYFADLISEQAWPKYLGELLLLNETNRPPVVDARWVGHSLARGFTALRWSKNTNRYPAMPRLALRS